MVSKFSSEVLCRFPYYSLLNQIKVAIVNPIRDLTMCHPRVKGRHHDRTDPMHARFGRARTTQLMDALAKKQKTPWQTHLRDAQKNNRETLDEAWMDTHIRFEHCLRTAIDAILLIVSNRLDLPPPSHHMFSGGRTPRPDL